MAELMKQVLLIDGNPADREAIKKAIQIDQTVYAFTCAANVAEGKTCLQQAPFDLIIIDETLPEKNDLATIRQVGDIPIILIAEVEYIAEIIDGLKTEKMIEPIIKDDQQFYLKLLPLICSKAMDRSTALQQKETLTHVLNQLGEMVILLSHDGIIRFANTVIGSLLETPVEMLIGQHWKKVFFPTNITQNELEEWVISTARENIIFTEGEYYYLELELEDKRHIQTAWVISHWPQGGFLCVGHDIFTRNYWENTLERSQIKTEEEATRQLNLSLEKLGQARANKLELANKELEAFSYSVSHDLRAYLRSINGYSQILLEDYELLDAKGKDYIYRIQSTSRKMELLMEDLLKLSKIDRLEINAKTVSLSDIVNEIAASLKESNKTRPVEWEISPDIVVQGDPGLLKIALENLISNAWKFTSQQPLVWIKFGTRFQNGQPVYFIQDNGIGFDMMQAEQLFEPFKRLNHYVEYEGTGIGLTIVKRIIQRHGGHIWAESVIGHGATFFFTLSPNGTPVSPHPAQAN